MDFGVILFIFNCWMNWWMWMIENGIIRFLEKIWEWWEFLYKCCFYCFMCRYLEIWKMVVKMLLRYDDKFVVIF